MSTANLLWSVLFGAVGSGYAVYGLRQKQWRVFLCGAALAVFPYFISSTVLLVLVGSVLVALPFVARG